MLKGSPRTNNQPSADSTTKSDHRDLDSPSFRREFELVGIENLLDELANLDGG